MKRVLLFLVVFLFVAAYVATVRYSSYRSEPERGYAHEPLMNHEITEITLVRLPCYGMCPVCSFSLNSDGRVEYVGHANVEHLGERDGSISNYHFNLLAEYILQSDFFALTNSYSRDITDASTTITTVVMNENSKSITNYANSGPVQLWALERLIDSVQADVQWTDEILEKLKISR